MTPLETVLDRNRGVHVSRTGSMRLLLYSTTVPVPGNLEENKRTVKRQIVYVLVEQ